jgi:hypothetical protein
VDGRVTTTLVGTKQSPSGKQKQSGGWKIEIIFPKYPLFPMLENPQILEIPMTEH